MKELLLTLIDGLFFLIGVVINKMNKGSKKVICFSIGMAFSSLILLLIIDIIPETFELLDNKIYIISGALIGVGILLLLEKLVPHHDHFEESKKHHHENHLEHIGIMTSLALIIHNIVEGIGIYGITTSSVKSGIIYSIAVGMHNIPFGLEISTMLNKSHNKHKKIYIIILTLSTFIGGLFTMLFKESLTDFVQGILLSVTIGMILYLLLAELLTELKENWHKETIFGIITGILIIIIGGLIC